MRQFETRRMSIAAVAVASLAAGVASYVLVVAAARTLPAAQNDVFAVFWSASVIVGLGVFFPIEQETSRQGVAALHRGDSLRPLLRSAAITAFLVGVIVVIGVALVSGSIGAGSTTTVLVAGMAAAVVGFGLQFTVRGMLSAEQRTQRYAVVVAAEAAVRIGLAVAFLAAALQDALWFCLIVGVGALISGMTGMRRSNRDAGSGNPGQPFASFSLRSFLARIAPLLGAAVSLQLLLNSPVLLAPAAGAAAGTLLAAQSLARIPVFVYQATQVLVIPRIARARAHGDRVGEVRLVSALVGAAIVVAALLVLAFAVLGRAAIRVVFGQALVPAQAVVVLVALAIGVFLVTLCVSDSLMATGGSHGWLVVAWAGGLGAAVLAWTVAAGAIGPVAPLLVGSLTALVVLVSRLVRVLLRAPAPTPERMTK